MLSRPVRGETGADSKGKAHLAASSNRPCRMVTHIQRPPPSCRMAGPQCSVWAPSPGIARSADSQMGTIHYERAEKIHILGWEEVGLQW